MARDLGEVSVEARKVVVPGSKIQQQQVGRYCAQPGESRKRLVYRSFAVVAAGGNPNPCGWQENANADAKSLRRSRSQNEERFSARRA